MQNSLPRHEIVLLGIGHTNAHIVRMWKMAAIPDTRLTCISDFPCATYSGMLPAVLAGQVPEEGMTIDLVRLCASAGARLIVANPNGIDRQQRHVTFPDRPAIPFDLLSIGVGSTPQMVPAPSNPSCLVTIKPMQTLLRRLRRRLDDLANHEGPVRVIVAGAGIGGVETSACVGHFITRHLPDHRTEIMLADAHSDIARGLSPAVASRIRSQLHARNITLKLGDPIEQVLPHGVRFASGEEAMAEIVLWVASARPIDLFSTLDWPKDDRGFLLTNAYLQTLADNRIFAVGDAGTMANVQLPKAGVYAVRQGPILWHNLRAQLASQPLHAYHPQSRFLKLVNMGDGTAIADWHGRRMEGRWVNRWKRHIDQRFMAMYQSYEPMPMSADSVQSVQTGTGDRTRRVRCAGCGGKVGASILSRALQRLETPHTDKVVLGIDAPDDAALIKVANEQIVVTTDFFPMPLHDAFLSGRLAALNAMSDIYAMGSHPIAALAIVAIPEGPADQQEQLLYELLAGGQREFQSHGVVLAGGHTIESQEAVIGYTILAESTGQELVKSQLRVGDRLVLTKALGTGTLLAAHMECRCQGDWMTSMLDVMLQSHQPVVETIRQANVSGLTDVTGFGLAGHLVEMLTASGHSASLSLKTIPLLDGFASLSAAGYESSLAESNRSVESFIQIESALQMGPEYAALFDPQTCGGLLIGVAPQDEASLLTTLGALGRRAYSIGEVTQRDASAPLHIG